MAPANWADDGVITVLNEAEAILNDRPLTKLSDGPHHMEPLSLKHLLQLRGKPLLPSRVL